MKRPLIPLLFIVLIVVFAIGGCANVAVQRAPVDPALRAQQLLDDMGRAQAALAEHKPDQALRLLDQPRDDVAAAQRTRWHGLRAQALEQQGAGFGAAAELAYLDAIVRADQRAANAHEIDRLLAALPDAELAQQSAALPQGHPLYAFAGHALTRRGLPLPRPYDRGARMQALVERPPAAADGYRPPLKVAVLLPSSGALAAAAGSVRDGLLTAYYDETRRRPELVFIDTAPGAAAAYRQAVSAGADFVVGPLDRDNVTAVFAAPALSVPMLALNRSTTPPPPGSVGFSLAPEDDGSAVADRLLQREARRVIAITGSDDNARRSLAAFRDRFSAGGGSVVGAAVIDDGMTDYTAALGQALAASGGSYDALFLALKAPQARLLVPQLPLAGIAGVPMVSTALILVGGGNPRLNTDLDGIEYPELPWVLGTTYGMPDAATVGRRLDSARGTAARLFAFGMDAWRLTAYMEHLTLSADNRVRGATGELSIDGFGNVQRSPAWAVFSGGRAHTAMDGGLISQPLIQRSEGDDTTAGNADRDDPSGD